MRAVEHLDTLDIDELDRGILAAAVLLIARGDDVLVEVSADYRRSAAVDTADDVFGITGTQLLSLLDRIPQAVSQLVIVATSTSGAVAERWSKPHRIVITATRSGGERNATRFGGYWAEALTSDEADRDKDGSLTAQEAYDFSVRKVGDAYKTEAAMATEHAKLVGKEPSRFVVARLGPAAMFASDAQLIAMREQQDGIERRLAEIRALKGQLSQDQYYDRLEPVLVEMARLGQRVDARLATLGVTNDGGAR